ncbi:R3H and coiled-coil domain-containing protein 1 isoform X2 [Accipiter gentilis]|nr:R3H and coiled-coil domain-containing protein 1 isoform X2 [Accipiter gentilis]XP_049686506.1 R3H and coiled-coil domain-containing protein 1 isoform X2 [Accipiter gentilis]XP_049686507.1 R3H and coiled-coil domain-containing protein 1 isoform X2 [Accipiter gentilis]XP_049686508.1 R3H and coiled-coil domain-containing protein 1 isoform X2 [Accipiter gentilis]
MDGVFLSPNEDEFVGRIAEELEHFMLQGQHHRVLLFPPLSSRLRYLIHRTVDNVDLLSSFSVGEGWRRRTVICHSAVRLPSETGDQKPSSNPPRPHRPPQPWGRGGRGGRLRHGGEMHGDNSRACVGSGRIKRPPRKKPDKALYIPKAMRKKAEWGEQESPVAAGTESGGNTAREEEICPKASVGDAQEELGKSEGSPGGVSLALGKQQEPGEECVSGKNNDEANSECPPCCMDVPPLENSNDFSGQESQDKDCSDSLTSVHNKSPTEAEDQDLSCDNAVIPEDSKILCQLRAEDQNSRDAGVLECGKNSSLSESRGNNCCTDLAVAESSAALPVLENQGKSCAAAKSLESGGNVSPPEEQGKDFVNAGLVEGVESFSELESQDQECPNAAQVEHTQCQNPLEARNEPLAASEPVCGADPSAPENQNERWEDAPVQNRSGKVPVAEEEDKECSGLADALCRELHLSAGDKEENAAVCGQGSLEDDCTAELFAEIVGYLTVKDISIEKISFDYSNYGDAQLSEGDFGHVTEIYDFSPSLKTEHLLEAFSDFHESGFKIQWVDDTHALGIFSSLSTASQALGRRYPSLKIRPLIHATKQSKIKALQRPKLLHLAKERPQTDTAVAKRLVTRALGLKHKQQGVLGTEMLLPESLDQEE